jgi:hypothetical protein
MLVLHRATLSDARDLPHRHQEEPRRDQHLARGGGQFWARIPETMKSFSRPALNPDSLVAPSTANAREWWAAESVSLGSDWISVAGTVSAGMYRLAGASS